MRVLILGIDALEYNLVQEWDLKNLKQNEYGKITVPIYKAGGEPVTLVVWPCFITGAEPEDMGYDSPILYRQPLKSFLDYFYFPVTSFSKNDAPDSIMYKQNVKEKIVSTINRVSMRAGLGRYPLKKDIKPPTFFDNPDYKSIHLHIPVYDESHTVDVECNPRNNVIGALSDSSLRKKFNKRLKEEFDER